MSWPIRTNKIDFGKDDTGFDVEKNDRSMEILEETISNLKCDLEDEEKNKEAYLKDIDKNQNNLKVLIKHLAGTDEKITAFKEVIRLMEDVIKAKKGMSNNQIDLHHLTKGIYYIKVQANNLNTIKKIINL